MTLTFPALTCTNCNRIFTYSADDQEFFLLQSYPEPDQCRPCRAAQKPERGNGERDVPPQARAATCSGCGKTNEIKFHLWGHPSAYCQDCFAERATVRSH